MSLLKIFSASVVVVGCIFWALVSLSPVYTQTVVKGTVERVEIAATTDEKNLLRGAGMMHGVALGSPAAGLMIGEALSTITAPEVCNVDVSLDGQVIKLERTRAFCNTTKSGQDITILKVEQRAQFGDNVATSYK